MQLLASDADDPSYGSSARVVYSVLEGEHHFTVDSKTGKGQWVPWAPKRKGRRQEELRVPWPERSGSRLASGVCLCVCACAWFRSLACPPHPLVADRPLPVLRILRSSSLPPPDFFWGCYMWEEAGQPPSSVFQSWLVSMRPLIKGNTLN